MSGNRFGGTCVNYSRTPTEALVASARAAHMARRAADFGVEIGGPVRVDMGKVKARKDEIAGASNEGVDADVSAAIAEIFEGEGIEVLTDVEVRVAGRDGGGVEQA